MRLKLTDEEKEKILSKKKPLSKKVIAFIDTEKKHLAELTDDAIKETDKVIDKTLKPLGFKKSAKVTVEDIERRVGMYFNDNEEATVRRMIGQQEAKRFALRHPKLTGIPTAGRAPALAERDAKREIVHSLLRKNLKYQRAHKAKADLDHQRYLDKTRAELPKTIATKALTTIAATAGAAKLLSSL